MKQTYLQLRSTFLLLFLIFLVPILLSLTNVFILMPLVPVKKLVKKSKSRYLSNGRVALRYGVSLDNHDKQWHICKRFILIDGLFT